MNYTGPAILVSSDNLDNDAACPLPPCAPNASLRYYDLYHGVEVLPQGGAVHLSVEAAGFGAVLATTATPTSDPRLGAFMKTMAAMTATPLEYYSNIWTFLQQQEVKIAPTKPMATTPAEMVPIPGGQYNFAVSGVEIEGGDKSLYDNHAGVDVQYPFDPVPRRYHSQLVNVKPFLMDIYPVSQGDFAKYLAATPSAIPADTWHYLMNWDWKEANSTFPAATSSIAATSTATPKPANPTLPVTYVGLDEARGYCTWAGKRLPSDIEWQYAAQGGIAGRKYPWGNNNNQSLYPKATSGNTFNGPEPIGTYGKASLSPFGVSDLVGNVWQYTSEFGDVHTRGIVVRGGSNYRSVCTLTQARACTRAHAGTQVESTTGQHIHV